MEGMSARKLAAVIIVLTVAGVAVPPVRAGQPADNRSPALEAAQHHFYSSRYTVAADQALQLINATPSDLAAFELRTSACISRFAAPWATARTARPH